MISGISGWFQSISRLGGDVWRLALDNPAQSAGFLLLIAGVAWFLKNR